MSVEEVMAGMMGARILVVEDDPDTAAVLHTRLAAAGYEVHIEAYGATALSYAVAHRPDLVILDVKLPDLNGYDVCQELRTFYGRSEVPVLLYTAMDDPIDAVYVVTCGADAYLTKQCEPTELLRVIDQLLHEIPHFEFA